MDERDKYRRNIGGLFFMTLAAEIGRMFVEGYKVEVISGKGVKFSLGRNRQEMKKNNSTCLT